MVQYRGHLRTWLSIYATGLAIFAALSIGVFLVQSSGSLNSPNVRRSIGLDLIASAVFSLIFASLATWVLDRNQRENTLDILSSNSDKILAQISSLDRKYLPVAEFPALDTFGENFNRSLMLSMEGSKIYDFYGPSPRFVAARLKRVRRFPEEVRVAMMDPTLDSAVMRRAADRENWKSSAGKSLGELERLFREELVMAIVSLFDFRTTSPVRIVYTSDMVVYRTELTDDYVFFSWYHGPTSSGKEMPESAQFGKDSLYYRVIRQEMTRRFEVLPRKALFDSSQTDSDLIIHLKNLTGTIYQPADLNYMRERYLTYTQGLTDFLRRMGY